jgi:hypothetical protein
MTKDFSKIILFVHRISCCFLVFFFFNISKDDTKDNVMLFLFVIWGYQYTKLPVVFSKIILFVHHVYTAGTIYTISAYM